MLGDEADHLRVVRVIEEGQAQHLAVEGPLVGALAVALGSSNLYVSRFHGGRFQPAVLVAGVNSTAGDARPNVSRDGRELVFDSNRSGGHGGFDIYVSRRHDVASPWSSPVNLGPAVNSAANETRPSLSGDGTRLYVGSNRDRSEAGSSDIHLAERDRASGR